MPASPRRTVTAASALATDENPEAAATEAAESLRERGFTSAELLFLFVSGAHTHSLATITAVLRESLEPKHLIGATSQGIVATNREVQRGDGISLLALSLPGVRATPFTYNDLPYTDADTNADALRDAMGMADDTRAVIFCPDPMSVPVASVLETLDSAAVTSAGRVPIIGGLATAARQGDNARFVLDDRVFGSGGVGVTISGDVAVDTVVSQGCRPLGPTMLVTGAQRNIIRTLGSKPAYTVLREIASGLSEHERTLLGDGLLIGRAIDEYKDRFGRGDFLIRGVLGVDQNSGAIAVSDRVRVGQTVQFHVRDAQTAREDLDLLLSAQSLRTPPAGALLFNCNGRGETMFGEGDHDAQLLSRHLAAEDEGLPTAGFFAAGEIGPIGDHSFLHGQTASIALFRDLEP